MTRRVAIFTIGIVLSVACGKEARIASIARPTSSVVARKLESGPTPSSAPATPHAIAAPTRPASTAWKLINAGSYFSFSAPEDMRQEKVDGIDSFVGQYRDPALALFFDYGWYSDSLEHYSNQPEYQEARDVIDGRAARVVFFRETHPELGYRYFGAVYFPDVGKTTFWPGSGSPEPSPKRIVKLELGAHFKQKGDWAKVRTIFKSIRFER